MIDRTGVQNRNQDEFKKAFENLKKLNKNQAELIKKKNAEIRNLARENFSLNYKLKVIQNKYDKLSNKGGKNEQD